MAAPARDWTGDVFRVLQGLRARQIAYVPDAGLSALIERCRADDDMVTVPLTTEEEGIALLAGAWLGGQAGALMMQSSGVGNCLNMLTLARECRFPLLIIVTMRGEAGETNPWQIHMGGIVGDALRLAGVTVERAEAPEAVGPAAEAAAQAAFAGHGPAALLVAQSVIGIKTFGQGEP
jgi:sulfopyruvate decarboxylase TPP-binding subunit